MIKRFIVIAALIGLLVSCPDTDNNHPNNKPDYPDNPKNKTFIVFDNTQRICAVAVYNDYRRRDEDKIAEIPKGNNSGKIAYTPGDSVPFYFSYRVTIKGFNDFSLNYVSEIGRDQKAVRIDADTTTTIKVPTLSESISSPDTLLSNNSYIFIQNNSSYSFELHRGTSKVKPENISSPLVNNGERAQYTINPGPASNYQLLVGADYKEFSGSIVNFEAGHIYYFEFNGNISLIKDTELKLENVNGFTIPQPPAAPIVIISNGSITLRWSAIESATAYEIWMSTVNNSGSATKHGTDVATSLSATISGLNNGTAYYFWLKAKNNMGTSGFSPVATGIPSATTAKPLNPQTAPAVIAGNGQLTVSWQAVVDADVYEIWAGTTNIAQTSTKQGEDISGLSTVITGLNNGTSYYVWIKAKNNIGVSGFSPSASGKPLGTPGAPTVSPNYKRLLVTWNAVAGADVYEVYYGIGTPTTLATTTTGTTVTITGLTGGTTYYVHIRAKNANGISDYGPNSSGVPDNTRSSGLYRGDEKIGNQNLTAALSWISTNALSGNEYYIVLGANESVSPTSLNYSGKTLGITLLGYSSERTITLNTNGSMFTIESNVTLTLDENITIVGRSTNNRPLISVYDGNLIMNDGSKINGNNSSDRGGGVYIYGGTFTMNGGTINGNTSNNGGGGIYVESNGRLIINGGTISGNTASSIGGGGICINGTASIYGGTITKNEDKSNYGGGGIIVFGGTLTMYGGTVSGNIANRYGGGVYVYNSGNFTMNGGIISGNTAKEDGGGVQTSYGTFRKQPPTSGENSGIIYGSEAIGIDEDGVPLKNTSSNNRGHAVYGPSSRYRNTTVEQTDQINTTTGKGLSANGEPPFLP